MPKITVGCPLCGKVIEIPAFDSVSRGDALLKHIDEECVVNKSLPNFPTVGPPFPKALGIKWPWRSK